MTDATHDLRDVWEAVAPGRSMDRAELYDGARRCGLSSAGLWRAIEDAADAGYLLRLPGGLFRRADLERVRGRCVLPVAVAAAVAVEPAAELLKEVEQLPQEQLTGNPGEFKSRWGWLWCRRAGYWMAAAAHGARGCRCLDGEGE